MRTLFLVGGLGLLAACTAAPEPTPVVPKGLPPNGGRVALECEAHGVRAFDPSRTLIPGARLGCTAHLADRTGAPVNGATVSFLVEAGRVNTPGVTSPTGTANVVLETATPLPVDTDPQTFSWTPLNDAVHIGELLAPTWMVPDQWTEYPVSTAVLDLPAYTLREPRRPDPIRLKPDGSGRYVNNPRDNLVTLIAAFDGEEGFTDTNANGTYDVGESFIDLTEPFVDSNDNGTWDSDEQFIDTNGNRQWDGRNGAWDHATRLWVMERILWTGFPEARDMESVLPGVVGNRAAVAPVTANNLTLTCASSTADCPQATSMRVVLYLADPWFNAVTRLGPADGCQVVAPESLPVTVTQVTSPGARELWPGGELIEFVIADKRDGTQNIPRRSPPISFSAHLSCRFTGVSGGAPQELIVSLISGTIE